MHAEPEVVTVGHSVNVKKNGTLCHGVLAKSHNTSLSIRAKSISS